MNNGLSHFTSPPEPIIIAVKDSEGREMDITAHWDSTIEDIVRLLRVVLLFLGYTEESVNKYIPEPEE